MALLEKFVAVESAFGSGNEENVVRQLRRDQPEDLEVVMSQMFAHISGVFDIDDFSTIMTTLYTLLLLFIISFISGRSTSGSSHGLIIALLSQPEMQAMVRSADGKAVSALATSTLLIPMEQIARLSMGTHSEAKVFVRVALAAREFLISMTRPSQNERRRQLKEQLETDAGMTDVVGKPGDPLPSLLSVIETSSANAEDRAVVLRAMEGYLRRVYFSYVLLLAFFLSQMV